MTKIDDVEIRPPDAPRAPGWVRLVVVSDTHNVDLPIALFPPGDLLIHAGDHTMSGLPSELASAATWLRSLAGRYTHGVVAIGGKHDPHLDIPGVDDLVGKLTLAESLGLIQGSSLHMAADTGTGHVAAAYGVPVVSLFGQTDPNRYQPFGSQCTVLQAKSAADIPPEDVAESALTQARGVCVS